MPEGLKGSNVNVYQSRRFEKALDKLSDPVLILVEDEIDKIIANPLLGEKKKGDLSYLRVHKFQLNNQLTLLGYSWLEDKIELYLLSISSHKTSIKSKRKIAGSI